ncbi:MAG TPA: site-specific integrase [Blastocatellia bacterium]|nr:site-specific integrase [Blastocatellia bacterium]
MSEITAYLRGKTWSFSIHDKEFVEIYGERVRLTCDAKGKREAIKCGEETRARLMAEALSKKLSIQVSPERILIDGKPAPLPTDTFAEFIDNWYKPWAELNKRPSTFKSDTWRLRVLVEHFGTLPLNQIIRPMVESFKAKEAGRINQYGRKQTGAAVNRLLELGSAVFTKLAEWTDYEYNPFRRIKHFREQSRKRVLSADEESRLVKTLGRPTRRMLRLCLLLALHAGLRKGEILNLRRRHVDFEQEWLLILDAKTGDRVVPMNKVVSRALRQAMPANGTPEELIFGGVDWIKDAWPTICREAGIEDLHFHDLRATYVTRILEAGYDSFTARDAAGHLDIRTTGIYARPSIERVREAVNSLSDAAQIQAGKITGRGR